MSFIQQKIVKIASQSEIFDKFIYATEDTLADVVVAGYFSACRYNIESNWTGSVVQVKCSDGLGKGYIDTNGDLVMWFTTPPVSVFCLLPTLGSFGASQVSFSVSGIESTVTRNVASDVTSSYITLADVSTVFNTSSSLVQQNVVFRSKVNAATDLVQTFGITLAFTDMVTFQNICSVTLQLREKTGITTGAALVDDLIGFAPSDVLIDNMTIVDGYEFGLFFQSGSGSASVKDSLGNDFPLLFSGTYNPANDVVGFVTVQTGTELSDSIVSEFNQGSEAFGVTKSGAVSWCNVV